LPASPQEQGGKQAPLGWILTVAVLGLLCIFAEVFLPGGVLGILGWLLIGTSVVAAYQLWGFSAPFVLLLVGFVTAGVILYAIAIKLMPNTAIGKLIFLRNTQKGYNVSVPKEQEMLGKEGVALSFLRPTGFAEIDGMRVNVVTEGEFVDKDARIKVCDLKDNYLVVREIDSPTDQPQKRT
jgi:membrane-bound serine protease (ClpP class)